MARDYHDLKKSIARISSYRDIIVRSQCPLQRYRFERLIITEINRAYEIIKKENTDIQNWGPRQEREFTLQELSSFDGSSGKPAYVAVNGIVYDVSNNPAWGGASHFGVSAGKDLTPQFGRCHGGISLVLSKLPKVGTLKPGALSSQMVQSTSKEGSNEI